MLLAKSNGVDSFAQFMTVLLIFILVLAITFFVTRWIGKFQKTQTTGANIEVVEATKISASAFAEIIRVGNKYIAVAVSKENVTYLCDVPEEDISFAKDGDISAVGFSNVLEMVKNNLPVKHDQHKSDGKDE